MVEFFTVGVLVPLVVMVWFLAAAVCRMAWKDFFRDHLRVDHRPDGDWSGIDRNHGDVPWKVI